MRVPGAEIAKFYGCGPVQQHKQIPPLEWAGLGTKILTKSHRSL
jgi:hypothetical protein